MITNTQITIYHKDLKTEKWTRINIENAWAFAKNSAVANKGYEHKNSLDVRIPYNKNKNLINIFFKGDIIISERVTKDIETSEDLSDYTIYHIYMNNNNVFGNNPHIHLKGE